MRAVLKTVALEQIKASAPASPAGTIAHDFGLAVQGRPPVVSVARRNELLPPSLRGELVAEPVRSRISRPDALLLLSPRRAISNPRGLPILRLQPGLLRAPPTPARASSRCSATLTGLDPYHPHRELSWTQRILLQHGWLTPELSRRAELVLRRLLAARLGGTWWGARPRSAAGQSVVFASHDRRITRQMLARSLDENGAAGTTLVIRRPGPWAATCRRLGITVLAGVVDPWPLIEEAASIHADADASEAAMLARLIGIPVQCHAPGPVSLASPIRLAAALLLGTRYADPFTGHPSSCEAFLDHAIEWRRHHPEELAVCVGISFWKRRRITEMLGAHGKPAFRRTAPAAVAEATRRAGSIGVWASRVPAGLEAQARAAQVALIRIEDGFIRSVGLGADFLPPLSIVLDRLGLYYDATGPSDLEALLSGDRFEPETLRRAAALRRRMVHDGVTKYNLPALSAPRFPSGRRVILVPGQVADDRSVLLGGGGARPGLELLRHVRRRNPGAYIVYKPHPDVDAGHRTGAVPDAEILTVADELVRGGSMAALLEQVGEVHTLTSLTGFEALLRGKPVTTYGHPFYAGWGLTIDVNPPLRRTRRLTLDELVAGALIRYPRYIDPVTLLQCGPEIVLDRLADPALRRANLLVQLRRLQGRLLERLRRIPPRPAPPPSHLNGKGAAR